MLKPKVIPKVLEQVLSSDGVLLAMLLNNEGSLLAFAGQTEREAKVFAAIASNIWLTYEKSGRLVFDNDLEYILIQNESGKVAVAKVSRLLVCIYAADTVEFGLLKAKLKALTSYLDEPLKQVMA